MQTLNINEPRYDQGTYSGRAKHFFMVTNPLNVLQSASTLERARQIITAFRKGELKEPITVNELWRQKYIYDSAFHPDTGEKQFVIGRMSAQVPMNMIITGGMMTFYQSNPAVIFWQWINQTFNALVNYTNRSGDAAISAKQLGTSYVLATTGAVGTAMTLNQYAKRLPPIAGRFVPFIAVIAANAINIPCMRMQEITEGTPVFDSEGNRLGQSTAAARSGIAQVIFSRVVMAAPGMMLTPFVIQHLDNKGIFKRRPWLNLPIQLGVVGFFLIFATPLACAAFKQKAEISFNSLESSLQEDIRKNRGDNVPKSLFYNKGL